MKLIWTEKELKSYLKYGSMARTRHVVDLLEPFELIKVEAKQSVEVKEMFKQPAILKRVYVKFPLGCRNLVTVIFWVAKTRIPERPYSKIIGDNLETGFNPDPFKVRKGTNLRVKLWNRDVYAHSVGVRADIK